MNENPLLEVDRFLEQLPVGQAPVGELVRARQRDRRRRRALETCVAAVVLVGVGMVSVNLALRSTGASTERPNSPDIAGAADAADADALTPEQVEVARTVAIEQAAAIDADTYSATATLSEGPVDETNTGAECSSPAVLRIKLIGDYAEAVPHSQGLGEGEPTTALLFIADSVTGNVCHISALTGSQTSEPGAAAVLP